VQQAFNAVDADGSGLLDRDEIRALLESLGKRPTEADIDDAMAELDADKSGEVDFEEFSGTYASHSWRQASLLMLTFAHSTAYWEAHFGSDGDGSGGMLQGLTVDLSEPLWRVYDDTPVCTPVDLSFRRRESSLTSS
jgi:hypothetical protein